MLIPSPIGYLECTFDGIMLTALRVQSSPGDQTKQAGLASPAKEVMQWIEHYFDGRCPDFLPSLKPHGSAFQLRVWQQLLKVPYGETITYGQLAQRVGCKSPQAVGQAVGHNPIAIIIPCHRVVAHDGIGGYAYGADIKRQLLQLEQRNPIQTHHFQNNP